MFVGGCLGVSLKHNSIWIELGHPMKEVKPQQIVQRSRCRLPCRSVFAMSDEHSKHGLMNEVLVALLGYTGGDDKTVKM
jgi:hypothetical protein